MSDNYFKTLFNCILLSFVLLIATNAMHIGPWAALASGITPLVYYHWFYLSPRAKKGLSQSAIDSVYYFGFLVTLAALGISAVAIATSGAATNINTVVFQFGVGVFATGYAVIARMHLSSISSMQSTDSIEVIMDRYVKRSLELVENVEMAVVRTADFSNIVVSKTTEVTENARISAEKVLIHVES